MLPYHYAAYFRGMWFTDSYNGYLVVDDKNESMPVLLITRDGGESWELRGLPLSADEEAPAIHFTSSETGFIAADNCILKTTDSGESRERIEMEGNFYSSVWFSDSLNGWCFGHDYYNGVAFRNADGGDTWERIPLISGSNLLDVCFTAPENGWICGDKGMILK